MKHTIASLFLATLAACATSQAPEGPTRPSGSVPTVVDEGAKPPGPDALTSRPECVKLVDHLDSVVSMTGHVDLFRAKSQDPQWLRSRVDECTITVDKYDRECLLGSRDVDTASRCNSRFFADTLRAYRFQ